MTQLRAKVEEATDAAVTEGQKDVQAAVSAGASYLDQAKNLASSAISTAAVRLTIFLWGFSMFVNFICSRIFLKASREEPMGELRSLYRRISRTLRHPAVFMQAARRWRADHTQ